MLNSMFGRGRRLSLYSRIFVSLSIMALIAALLIVILMPLLMDSLREQTVLRYGSALEQTRASTDGIFGYVFRLSSGISQNQNLRPSVFKRRTTLQQLDAQDELKEYMDMNPAIVHLFLYLREPELLINNDSVIPLEEFGKSVFRFESVSSQDLISDMRGISARSVRLYPAQNVYYSSTKYRAVRILAFTLPLNASDNCVFGSMLAFLDEAEILRALSSGWTESRMAIVGEDGALLASTGEIGEEELSAIMPLREEGAVLAPIGGGALASVVRSKSLPLYVVALSTEREAYAEIRQVRNILLLTAALLTCALGALMTALIRWNYRPMRQLLDAAGCETENPHAIDESHFVADVIDSLRRDNAVLTTQLQGSYSHVRESLLHRLVLGQYDDIQGILAKCRDVGFDLSFAYGCVCLIHFDGRLEYEELDEMAQLVSGESGEATAYIAPEARVNVALCVITLRETDPALVALLASRIATCSRDLTGKDALVCVSEPCEIGSLHDAYRSVSPLFEAARSAALRGVHLAGELIGSQKSGEDGAAELYAKLHEAVMLRDATLFRMAIDGIVARLFAEDTPLREARMLAMETMGTLCDAGRGAVDPASINPFANDWMRSAEQMAETLIFVSNKVARQYAAADSLKRNELIESILLYIDGHLQDDTFSIQTVSDAFCMTVSNFSHMFKRSMNVTFILYINELKIRRARQMLLETDTNVEEIAHSLGYSNASNFARMFKKYTGLTPSQMRKNASIDTE